MSGPNGKKNFLNIVGKNYSGKSHLVSIFLRKFSGTKFSAKKFNNSDLDKTKKYENIILEDLNKEVDENLIYSLFNTIELNNKYLIITSTEPITNIPFDLVDLKSRSKNFLYKI